MRAPEHLSGVLRHCAVLPANRLERKRIFWMSSGNLLRTRPRVVLPSEEVLSFHCTTSKKSLSSFQLSTGLHLGGPGSVLFHLVALSLSRCFVVNTPLLISRSRVQFPHGSPANPSFERMRSNPMSAQNPASVCNGILVAHLRGPANRMVGDANERESRKAPPLPQYRTDLGIVSPVPLW